MTIDSNLHAIDPLHGFAVDKEGGHIIGLMQAPEKKIDGPHEYPNWVVPHDSHVVRKVVDGAPAHVSVPGFADFHVSREDGMVKVLVKDADEEAKALAPYKAPKSEPSGGVADLDGEPAAGGTPKADFPT